MACARLSALLRLVSLSGSSTFSSAVSTGIRLNCWKMKPMCSLRQWAISRSLISASAWPSTCKLPEVGRSIAAMRCSSVDLPEPDGPISTTNSPFSMVRVTCFSATTWNSSRTNSLLSFSVSIIVSLMVLCLRLYLVAIFQARGRADNHVFASDEPVFDAHAPIAYRSRLYRPAHRPAVEHHKDGTLLYSFRRHHPRRPHRLASGRRALLVGKKRHAGIHFGPEVIVRRFHLYFDLHGGLLPVGLRRNLLD